MVEGRVRLVVITTPLYRSVSSLRQTVAVSLFVGVEISQCRICVLEYEFFLLNIFLSTLVEDHGSVATER
jgi:hypothetical protein